MPCDHAPTIEARPTEYSGVVFRSKSEAIMARCFELAGFNWYYEVAHEACPDGWEPDFTTLKVVALSPRRIHTLTSVWEFKPRMPTNTYLEKLEKDFALFWRKNYAVYLIVADPFDDSSSRQIFEFDHEWIRCPPASEEYLFRHIPAARKHRYDLR